MQGKYHVKTFGCQMNEYDSQKMADILDEHFQLSPTDTVEDAEVILLNTCSIREKAQEKVFHQLGRWKKLKARNPHLVIGVGGCVASQEGKSIIKRAPFVDLVFGPQTIHRLPEMIREAREKQQSVVDISFPEIEKFDHLPEPRAEGVKAFVSIMEGCSKYCSYCIVPYTRGVEVSRPFDDVLAECAALAEQGVREITLLGQNVNHYLHDSTDPGPSRFIDYDLLFIDGDHSYDGVYKDLEAWYDNLMIGGHVLFHDSYVGYYIQEAIMDFTLGKNVQFLQTPFKSTQYWSHDSGSICHFRKLGD